MAPCFLAGSHPRAAGQHQPAGVLEPLSCDGEAWQGSKAKIVKNFKYQWGRNQKKHIELPAAEPADGGRGGNVYLRVQRTRESR